MLNFDTSLAGAFRYAVKLAESAPNSAVFVDVLKILVLLRDYAGTHARFC